MKMRGEEQTMEEITRTMEQDIAEKIDFRLLVYLYMYQHPEATKVDIAKRLGITPITMSRAVAAGKKGIDKELVPKVLELIRELDYNSFSMDMYYIKDFKNKQSKLERADKLRKILCGTLNCNMDNWQDTSALPLSADYVLNLDNEKKRYFFERTNRHNSTSFYKTINLISRIPGNEDVTFICYTHGILKMLMGKRTLDIMSGYKIKHPVTVMLMDLENERIEAEYILYDPERKLEPIEEIEEDFEVE